jgi:hypothetical protein
MASMQDVQVICDLVVHKFTIFRDRIAPAIAETDITHILFSYWASMISIMKSLDLPSVGIMDLKPFQL